MCCFRPRSVCPVATGNAGPSAPGPTGAQPAPAAALSASGPAPGCGRRAGGREPLRSSYPQLRPWELVLFVQQGFQLV